MTYYHDVVVRKAVIFQLRVSCFFCAGLLPEGRNSLVLLLNILRCHSASTHPDLVIGIDFCTAENILLKHSSFLHANEMSQQG